MVAADTLNSHMMPNTVDRVVHRALDSEAEDTNDWIMVMQQRPRSVNGIEDAEMRQMVVLRMVIDS